MKYSLITILLCCFTLTVMGQADSGFTNKTEAKNLKGNGLKEGKWVEYYDSTYKPTTNPKGSSYILAVYRADKHWGIVRTYDKSGTLISATPFTNDKINGVAKMYFKSGIVADEMPYTDNIQNGIEKDYYPSGKLQKETPYVNGKVNGVSKGYYEDGKIKTETTFVNDVLKLTKFFDENGKETQQ
jgi:antitoxin component YwqK of YwqJK toxin-antitoxin module